jgi:hypothetical protein
LSHTIQSANQTAAQNEREAEDEFGFHGLIGMEFSQHNIQHFHSQ